MNKPYDLIDIIGKPLTWIGRAIDMGTIGFGEKHETIDYKGQKVMKAEYALHLQTPWRIVDEKTSEIIVASYDMYVPRSDSEYTEYSEEFDWDIQGNNLYDEICEKLRKEEVYVEKVFLSKQNDIKIWFSNQTVLETFTNHSDNKGETWRFFKICDEDERIPHMVAYGTVIEW
ncbi:MAG: hypothetical protein E7491_01695 [Ruminococcaceae bacterium]|nr:hypothetical protein [Oscillospiraceae bacterium]